MWIRPLADADASCGAKAHGLARLIAAGLRVPEGFVLDPAAFRELAGVEAAGNAVGPAGDSSPDSRNIASHGDGADAIPAELDRDVRAHATALGRLAVRSSAAVEDGELGSAAGVFVSVTDVAPEKVWDAIRTVWSSALTPLAVAYACRRSAAVGSIDPTGEDPRPAGTAVPTPRDLASPIAVILQRFVAGARMTIYTRAVGSRDDDLWLQRDGTLERLPRSAAANRPEAAIALAAEAAIGATRGADVELVLETTPHGVRPWIVQARPIVHPDRPRRRPPPPIVLAPLVHDGRRWTWDIAHNPDPLSPAQAGLVEHVDRAAWSPSDLRVCSGYLYTTPRAPLQAPAPPADLAELAARIAAIEARFVLGEPESVAQAVEQYVAFMGLWTCELSPLVAAARRKLLDRLARDGHPAERIPALAAALIGPRRVQRDRVMSPAWDVAVPTFAEQAAGRPLVDASVDASVHASVDGPVAAASGPGAGTIEPPRELAADVALARAAADAAEQDDIWFARAQWLVRRSLLAHATALALP